MQVFAQNLRDKKVDGGDVGVTRKAFVEALEQNQRLFKAPPSAQRPSQRQKLRRLLWRKVGVARAHFVKQLQRLVAALFVQQQREVSSSVFPQAIFAPRQRQQLVVTRIGAQVVRRATLRVLGQIQRFFNLAGADELARRAEDVVAALNASPEW